MSILSINAAVWAAADADTPDTPDTDILTAAHTAATALLERLRLTKEA